MARFIYALIDPADPCTWHYIGQTSDPARRMKDHLCRRISGQLPVNKWINQVFKMKRKPEMVLLQVVDTDSGAIACWEETAVISGAIKAGHPLKNLVKLSRHGAYVKAR